MRLPLALALLLPLALASGAGGCGDPQQTPVSGGGSSRQDLAKSPGLQERGEGVSGRVTAADGTPVAGAFVEAESLDRPSQPIPEVAISTREDGRYLWPLSPGSYRISVSAAGYQRATGQAAVRAGRLTALDFTLAPSR
jgi:hypothetical protein